MKVWRKFKHSNADFRKLDFFWLHPTHAQLLASLIPFDLCACLFRICSSVRAPVRSLRGRGKPPRDPNLLCLLQVFLSIIVGADKRRDRPGRWTKPCPFPCRSHWSFERKAKAKAQVQRDVSCRNVLDRNVLPRATHCGCGVGCGESHVSSGKAQAQARGWDGVSGGCWLLTALWHCIIVLKCLRMSFLFI